MRYHLAIAASIIVATASSAGAQRVIQSAPIYGQPQPQYREPHSQPYMVDALQALKTARGYLVSSSQDKGGHRQRAIQLIDQATAETQAGIRYANGRGN